MGSGLVVVSATLFLFGISLGGTQYAWRSAAVLVLIIMGIVGLAGTVLYERNIAKIPFLRLSLFQTWSQIAAYLSTVLQAFL
jgi:hypothetical protein